MLASTVHASDTRDGKELFMHSVALDGDQANGIQQTTHDKEYTVIAEKELSKS
jgi:hypothetical protein